LSGAQAHGAAAALPASALGPPERGLFGRLAGVGLALGLAGLLAALALGSGSKAFYVSWLFAFHVFLSIALGGMFFVLTHYVTRAWWSVVVRRIAEWMMGTLPLFALLFIPVVLGAHELFHWTHEEAVAHDPVLQSKTWWLDLGFFFARAAIYVASWSAIAWWFLRQSYALDVAPDPRRRARAVAVSAPAIIVAALTTTGAAVDWVMSLDPHWYSTIFGVYYFSGCMVGALAVLILITAGLRRAGLLAEVVTIEHFHDLGKLLFGFTVFWAYIAFSQYFLIWYGNLPEETVFFAHRQHGGWGALSTFLAWGHFGVPFFFLMSRHIKRRTGLLVAGASWMLLMHVVDLYWLIVPMHVDHLAPSLLDVVALLAVGGLFLAGVGWQMRRHPLVPRHEPRLAESLEFANF
jgi:hypothetical protein